MAGDALNEMKHRRDGNISLSKLQPKEDRAIKALMTYVVSHSTNPFWPNEYCRRLRRPSVSTNPEVLKLMPAFLNAFCKTKIEFMS